MCCMATVCGRVMSNRGSEHFHPSRGGLGSEDLSRPHVSDLSILPSISPFGLVV